MHISDRPGPAINCVLCLAVDLFFYLEKNFLVNARYRDKYRWPDFQKSFRQVFEERTVGERHTSIQQRDIGVPGGHMRQGQKGHADMPVIKIKLGERILYV